MYPNPKYSYVLLGAASYLYRYFLLVYSILALLVGGVLINPLETNFLSAPGSRSKAPAASFPPGAVARRARSLGRRHCLVQ